MEPWTVREAWDGKKRPKKLTVYLTPSFWADGGGTKKMHGELLVSVKAWLDELKRHVSSVRGPRSRRRAR